MSWNSRSARWTVVLLLFVVCSWGVASARVVKKSAPHVQEIVISNFAYQPDKVTVHVGDTVRWKNSDIVPHTITAADSGFDSGAIAPGATWKLVVKKPGSFPYTCTPHPNMHGQLIVE